MDSIIAESNRQGKAAHIKAYIHAVSQANTQILQEVLNMGNAKKTLDQVLEESGLTVGWEARGKEHGKKEIAQNALREGSSPDFVRRITGLDFDAISKMQANLPVVAARA